jgi:prepilin-type N-terminal cleavage/methylation domain-containing protein
MKSRRRSRGVSLIEVLVAVSLFALVGSAVGVLATSSMVHTIRNKHSTAATMLAQERLETLRGLPYADIVSSSGTSTVGGQLYTISTGVLSDNPAAGMKRITITVNWSGPEGVRNHAIETIFTSVTS